MMTLDELSNKKSVVLSRDNDGEQTITQIDASVDSNRLQEIINMEASQLIELPTHEKVVYLRAMIDKNTPSVTQGVNLLVVDRESILQDSMKQFQHFKDLKHVLNIKFEEEVSQDRGGLSREFFQQIFKEICAEGMMLFKKANTENFTYTVDEMSHEIVGN